MVVTDTVMFRRISLDNELRGSAAERNGSAAAAQCNCLALFRHRRAARQLAANPFGLALANIDLADTLRNSKAINDCDVPLALVLLDRQRPAVHRQLGRAPRTHAAPQQPRRVQDGPASARGIR